MRKCEINANMEKFKDIILSTPKYTHITFVINKNKNQTKL